MTEIVCSWDVGIKNLAYCILEKQNDSFKILNWNIINLTQSTGSDQKCDNCKKKAGYTFQARDKSHYYCKHHCDKLKSELTEEHMVDPETDQKCSFYNKHELCDDSAVKHYNGTIHVCKKHYKTLVHTKNKGFLTYKQKKSTDNLYELNKQLYSELDKINDFSKVTHVIIENQPAYINPVMKTISVFVFSYFTYKKINNLDWKLNKVSFYSASNKMKIDNMATTIEQEPEHKKYKKTKEMSVVYCSNLLKNKQDHSRWLTFLNSFKKKDDLADSLLQGIHFIGQH
jgi:hypothetical protein